MITPVAVALQLGFLRGVPGSLVGDVVVVPGEPEPPVQESRPVTPISEFARYLRTETVGGVVLLVATAIALVWANSPWSRRALRRHGQGRRAARLRHRDVDRGRGARRAEPRAPGGRASSGPILTP
jgi:hypothetical protein